MRHVIDPQRRPYDPATVAPKPVAGIEPLAALDLRVGVITDVEDFPEARKPSWKLTVDLGPLGERRSSAQLTNYAADELLGRRVVCAVNLGTRRIAGFTSELLVLAGLQPDGTPLLLGVDDSLAPGLGRGMSEEQEPFESLHVPLHGFELTVAVDRPVYAAGETVRITVAATNDADRAVEHVYPGWQRVVLSVRDERHRPVATDEVVEPPPGVGARAERDFRDRWLPGQLLLLPTWWDQRAGALRPAWVADPGVAARVAPGRYRVRASWRGREPGPPVSPPEAWSSWFELV